MARRQQHTGTTRFCRVGCLTFKGRHKCCHVSAFVKCFVSISAICCDVWMYLSCTFSRVHVSWSLSISTRCVRDICLIVGHRPLRAILMAASLSSAMIKGTDGFTSSPDVFGASERFRPNNLRITSQNVSMGRPSWWTAWSRETISASVDECDTTVCFLHIAVTGT